VVKDWQQLNYLVYGCGSVVDVCWSGVDVCVCVCVREREREREKAGENLVLKGQDRSCPVGL
jgi:hypothetical protein